jgi:predicted SAM-dependent methyltransferase
MNYNKIMSKTHEMNERLGSMQYRANRTLDFAVNKKVLHFGSGNIENSNHKLYENLSSEITSVDNDQSSGADFKKIEDVSSHDYDVIIAEHVFEHIPIQCIDKIAINFKRLIKDKGIILFTVPNIMNFGGWFCDHQHVNFAPPDQIAAIFELAGFEAIDRFGWSKQRHFERHSRTFTETEVFIANFLQQEYGLQLHRYVSYVLKSNS